MRWIVPGVNSALESQYHGLMAIDEKCNKSDRNIVLIHDGVRPLIDDKVISDCIRETNEYGSAVTVAPAIETIIRADEEHNIKDTFPRSEC